MAERKDAITLYAESEGIPISEAQQTLRDINKSFKDLYEDGVFNIQSSSDLKAHRSLAAAFKQNPALFRAFDSFRRLPQNGGVSVMDTLNSAANSLGVMDVAREASDSVFGTDYKNSVSKALMDPYGFIQLADGSYSEPWSVGQAEKSVGEALKGVSPLSDAEQTAAEIDEARRDAVGTGDLAGTRNVFLDDRPQVAAMRQQTSNYKDNPFLQGYEGNTTQIDNLLDIAGGEVSEPTSDARSRRKYQNARSSKEFVEDAAKRKLRSLDNIAQNRAKVVQDTLPEMKAWASQNEGHIMADKGVDNWTDEEKINFTKWFNRKNTREGLAKIDAERKAAFRENLFNPGPMDKVPVYGKNGLEGYRTRSLMEKDMDGESFKYLPRDETREEREARLLADLKKDKTMYGGDFFPEARDEYYRRTKEPTAEEYYGIQERARARAKTDPTLKTNIADAVVPANFNQPIIPKAQQGPQQPLNEVFSSDGVVDKFQKETIPNMRNKVSSEVSSVLNDVPMPSMPKTVKYNPQSYKPNARTMLKKTPESSTFSIEQPSTPGVDLTRTTKEYPTENVFVDSNDTPGVDLTRTGREYPTMEAAGAQFRRPTQGFGRSGKKQYNIDFLDRFDLDKYDYRPNAPKHPGGGFGRSGKKQYNLDFLNFLDPDNYFYNQ